MAQSAHRRPLRLVAAILAATTFLSVPATADSARVERMKVAFAAWAERSGVVDGALAIVEGGKLADDTAIGGGDPDAPEPVASESKAITAMCALKLVEEGRLATGDTLGALTKKAGYLLQQRQLRSAGARDRDGQRRGHE